MSQFPSYIGLILRRLPGVLLGSLAAWSAHAEEAAERMQLMALLEEQTELATKTRLNADYVPGIMNILHGEELEARGARTVWDALGFIPGVNPVVDQLGRPHLVVRGLGTVGDNWSSGTMKVLLNGIAFNSANYGLAETVFYIPVEQVERIEVIRGPGSAVHGEYAIAGVINIVTRREGNRLFAFGGSDAYRGGGLVLTKETTSGLRLTLNASEWSSDGTDAEVKADALHQSGPILTEASAAPGQANEGVRARNGIIDLAYGNFSLSGQWSKSDVGDYFGVNYILPPEDRLVEERGTRSLEGRYQRDLDGSHIEAFAGQLTHRVRKDDLYAFPSEYLGIPDGEPLLVDQDYEERKRYTGVDWSLEVGTHQLLLAWYAARIEVHQAEQSDNYGFSSHALDEGTARDLNSAIIQDEFRFSNTLTITAGARYDHYSGVNSSISPRLAGVWRFGERRVLKAQSGRAFRPPTLTEEAAGEPGIDPTTTDTYEIGYLEKGPRGEWRVTVAYSELRDLIIFDPAHAPDYYYTNAHTATLRNIEFEGKLHLDTDTAVSGSLAYANTGISGPADAIPGSSEWLGRLGLQRQLPLQATADLQYSYVSGYYRQPEDPRPEADGYDVVDLTLTARPAKGTTIRVGVANLFDAAVYHPAFLTTDPVNAPIVSYPDDLPRAGRTYWIQLAQGF